MFSPYYYWAGRRAPRNHCSINVGLYGADHYRWTMTERSANALKTTADSYELGPSSAHWDGTSMIIDIDEFSVPFPRKVQGRVKVTPHFLTERHYQLDTEGRHFWQPFGPLGRIEVEMTKPALRFAGDGYFDSNWGSEPLEAGFSVWDWSRGHHGKQATILYDAIRRDESNYCLGLTFNEDGSVREFAPPGRATMAPGFWRLPRSIRSDGPAKVLRTFEDSPFYCRSLVEHQLHGQTRHAMHESLSLNVFRKPWLKCMLPVRMPRRTR